MTEIKLSDKFTDKLMNDTFIDVGSVWYHKYIWWVIDSKYGKVQSLDRFLSEQLKNPDERLINVAKNFTGTYNSKIIQILKFVHEDIRYLSDREVWNKNEYWPTAIKTLDKGTEDCDGMNSLIYILARLAGIPRWMIWCVIGKTAVGGHFWLNYYWSGKWYAIDATYHPDMRPIAFRPEFKLNINTYQDIWHVFNETRVYKYDK